MSEALLSNYVLFESTDYEAPVTTAGLMAADCLTLGSTAMQFAAIDRVPRYTPESRENDAEHSFMLALVAGELAARYYPALDTGLVSQFAIVHDLIEIKTNDVATFTLSEQEIAIKEANEHDALADLVRELPRHTAHLLVRYETQLELEARFVRLVDKILPVIVDILGPGKQVMNEDYDIHTSAALCANESKLAARLLTKFPDQFFDELHQARTILAERFNREFASEK